MGPGLLESAYGYRVHLVVADTVVVEVKAVERLTPLHDVNVPLLRDGIVRRVLGLQE